MSILGWNFFLEIVSQKVKWVGGGLEKLHYLTSSFVPPILFFSPWDLVLEITLSNTAKLSRNVYILLLLSFRNSTMHLGQLFFLIGWNFKCLLLFYFFIFYHLYPICTWTIIGIGPLKYFILFYEHEIQDGHIHRHFDHLSIDTKKIFFSETTNLIKPNCAWNNRWASCFKTQLLLW